jgi:hypothetical protein
LEAHVSSVMLLVSLFLSNNFKVKHRPLGTSLTT